MVLPRLHLVTDDAVLAGSGFLARAGEVVAHGGSRVAVHLRGPSTSGRRLWELGEALLALCREAGARLLVNDRVDVAAALAADGIQLGARSLPPTVALAAWARGRSQPSRPAWLGASVHAPAGIRRLDREGELGAVDFLVVGTLFSTPSHPDRPGAGPGRVAEVARASRGRPRPIVGIGGVGVERVPSVLEAGAYGVAVLRGVWDADDPAGAVAGYLTALADGTSGEAEYE